MSNFVSYFFRFYYVKFFDVGVGSKEIDFKGKKIRITNLLGQTECHEYASTWLARWINDDYVSKP